MTTPEVVQTIQNAALDDRRLKVQELGDIVGISKTAVHRILSENSDMKKRCSHSDKSSVVNILQLSV